ncbi:uncharacterized protein [Physcomitrium patens]|uniref:Uncharacterized protein n=1 Tax=Physcomitrium patens TaxID=3218 RepID=A0A2K1J6Z7_PHYPA|nr:uncharacterized protein LOC112293522 [Physcomitrium patens]XP_024398799.1 uncharacterized protein LOC112293522 [Physcomitrium patens]PNR37301.1 hypothetical protein PHYPA_020409 [Physcomitrium patens]|eukprot:XP_024398798.1 uncharacterized protein LOC112293522 [Physcomitrella patens]
MYQHSMAFAAATSPGVAGPIRCNSETSQSNRKEIKSFLIQCSISQIQLKHRRSVTPYLQCCPLFAGRMHSNIAQRRGKYGRFVVASYAKDILFSKRSSSAPQVGIAELTGILGIPTCPQGPSRFTNLESLRWAAAILRSEVSERGSSVRTYAGRNKKWRNLDKKGRLEGNSRTRGNGNANPGKSKSTQSGDTDDGTENASRVKPKKGPKPKERVSWAGQDMLLLNTNERFKVGKEVTPWASVPGERMPDDYYKYGPFGPHAWKGVCVGTPKQGTLCDQLVVFFSSVRDEEEHELGDIQDAMVGYGKRVDQMDASVGIQYYFVFVRQVQKLKDLPPWEEWTLVAQVAIESGEVLDKWTLGFGLHPKLRKNLTECVAWYRPDLIYVKRPAYQVRFEPQNEFLEGLLTLLNPDGEDFYFQRLCKLLGVDVSETADQASVAFDGLSENRKLECVEHVLTANSVTLLGPYTIQAMKQDQQRGAVGFDESIGREEGESNETDEAEGDWSEDADEDEDEEDDEEEFESEMEAFNGQFGEDFDFDEQGDSQSDGNEWEKEEAKSLAAMQRSSDAETVDVDDEGWDEQAVKAYSEIGITTQKGHRIAEETATQKDDETFLDAAVRPFNFSNLIQEIFIIREALLEYPELRH